MKNKKSLFIILCIILLGSVLRTPITGIGAIIGIVKETLSINNTLAGFITTIPLIAFAILSPVVTKISNKNGLEKTLFYSTIVITIGLALRFYINTTIFFVSTFIIGIGIALGNVLLPAVTKKYFADNLGVMTGIYTVTMTVTASFAAAVSYPLATSNLIGKNFSLGLALNIWIIIGILCIITYYILSKNNNEIIKKNNKKVKKGNVFKNPKLYSLMITMGLQSALYYCSVSWFGEIMISKGFSNTEAGILLSISQFAQFPATFIMPIIADKLKNKMIIPLFISLSYIGSIIALLYINYNMFIMIIIMIFYALAGGGSFSYVMYLFSSKTRNTEESSQVSGLSQSGGYILAAIFPPLLGYIKDISDWNSTMYVLLGMAIVLLVSMVHCSKEGYILEK